MIFDEATSALDNDTESAIMEAIERLHGKKTLVIIAHRLTTIQNADRILVLFENRIVEEGNHKALMEKKRKCIISFILLLMGKNREKEADYPRIKRLQAGAFEAKDASAGQSKGMERIKENEDCGDYG